MRGGRAQTARRTTQCVVGNGRNGRAHVERPCPSGGRSPRASGSPPRRVAGNPRPPHVAPCRSDQGSARWAIAARRNAPVALPPAPPMSPSASAHGIASHCAGVSSPGRQSSSAASTAGRAGRAITSHLRRAPAGPGRPRTRRRASPCRPPRGLTPHVAVRGGCSAPARSTPAGERCAERLHDSPIAHRVGPRGTRSPRGASCRSRAHRLAVPPPSARSRITRRSASITSRPSSITRSAPIAITSAASRETGCQSAAR